MTDFLTAAAEQSSRVPCHGGLHSAFLSAGTSLSCGTAALITTNNKWQSSHSSLGPTPASSGSTRAFPALCYPHSCSIQQPGMTSSPTSQLRHFSMPASCPPRTRCSRLFLRTCSTDPSLWRRQRPSCAAYTMADQQPSWATLESCCDMHSCQLTQTCLRHPTCWPLACWCSSMQLSAQGRSLSLGSPPLSRPFSKRATPQTQPTTGP